MLRKNTILGVDITNAAESEVLEYIWDKLQKSTEKVYIVTPNPEIVVHASKDKAYREILNNAQLAVPDGIGLMLAGKILGKPLKERISGIDLLEKICARSSGKPISIGLLGARAGVAERAAECLMKKYPDLKIVYVSEEWGMGDTNLDTRFTRINKQTNTDIKISEIPLAYPRESIIDILFVAYGAPKQEKWIAQNIDRLPVRVMMGVGGAFDILSGDINRAPVMLRRLGMEWLYRLIRQPWRWRRQLALVEFGYLVFKTKVNNLT